MGYSDPLSFIDLTDYLLKLMYDESHENDLLKAIRARELYCFRSLYIVPIYLRSLSHTHCKQQGIKQQFYIQLSE